MFKAYDARLNPQVRKRAKEALAAMEKRSDAVMARLAGDYGESCVEFLRVFDVDDHDIARTYPEETGFRKFLDEMFVQGRVFDNLQHADEAAPNEGSRKTLARIALEEVQDEYTVSYGNKTRKLWASAGGVAFVQECRQILGSLGGVVRDLKDRMAVEIAREDLQAAFVAFDLGAWRRAIARAQGKSIDASMLDAHYTRTQLTACAARLCKIFLGIDDGEVGPEWKRMVRLAIEQRHRMRIGPRCSPSEYVRTAAWDIAEPNPIDNRMVWRLVLESGGVPLRLRPVVLAYFACLHGSGCVERGLGRDKRAVVEPHVGSLRPSAEVEEENSKCLELHRDGPMHEHDLFVKSSENDVLLLTEFSRACAVLWLETHGRRFGANAKVRKDVAVPANRKLGQQTDAALRRGARSCYAKIAQEANSSRKVSRSARCLDARPTILGVQRKDLMKEIRTTQDLETVTKGTKRYREFTKRKAREKENKRAKDGLWAGWAIDRPVMRLGGAAAVQTASSCAAAHADQARRWLGRARARPGQVKAAGGRQVPRRPAAPREEATPLGVGSAICPAPPSSTTKFLPSLSTMRSQTVLVAKSKLQDGCSGDDLRKWVVAIAFGKLVLVDSDVGPVDRCRLQPALGRARELRFTQKFSRRHPELAQITSAIAECDGSKWRVWPAAPAKQASSRNTEEIDSCASFVRLLRSMMVTS